MREPLIVVVGETASGKSALAHELAQRFDGEIISADSWTVYKDFDIGTAKPSEEERREVPYHLLDVADPREGFSVVLFQQLAREAMRGIHARGKVPIMVGGTGLYIDSVLYDYGFLPAPDPAVRQELSALSLEQVIARAHDLGLDLSMVDTRNKRRVMRLIENNGQLPSKQEMRADTLVLGIQLPREELKQRVMARVDAMLEAGLEEEVKRLAERYGWEAESMKGIGYREWVEYFAGTQTREETHGRIMKATMDLAKRQRTWFKRNKSIQWNNNGGERHRFVDLTTTYLHKR